MKLLPHFDLTLPLLVLSALIVQNAALVKEALEAAGRAVKKEIAAIKQPIDEAIFDVVESQCSNVKKLIGVDYDQVNDTKEPDLNNLELVFRSRELKMFFNLSSAAQVMSAHYGCGNHSEKAFVIYMHGFIDDTGSDNFGDISDALLSTGEFNILGLDASSLIGWLYLRSTTYVRFIGEKLGEVLAAMHRKGLKSEAIHLIGHSLGAHIAGFTGKQFLNVTGVQVGHITGLDPAGPCFTDVDPELRLNATDAQFVDAIHTDSGVYGIDEVVGHADFFPNGGSEQPNCLLQTCSHGRVNKLYAESITNQTAFLALQCEDYDGFKNGNCTDGLRVMGYACPNDTRGQFYLRTGEESPYGLGEEGATWENNEGIVRNVLSAIF